MIEQYLNWISSLDPWSKIGLFSACLLLWGGYFVPKAYGKFVGLSDVAWYDWYAVRFAFWGTVLIVSISASVMMFAVVVTNINILIDIGAR